MNISEIKTLSAFRLANEIAVGGPESSEAAGAVFLSEVRDDFVRAVQDGEWDAEDGPWAIADAAVPIYTHEVWSTFVDLAAYQEDISEYIDTKNVDMEQYAKVALYVIAERLVNQLAELLGESEDDES